MPQEPTSSAPVPTTHSSTSSGSSAASRSAQVSIAATAEALSFAPGVGAESAHCTVTPQVTASTRPTPRAAAPKTNPCAPIHAASATSTPPMSSASAIASGPGGGVSARARPPAPAAKRSANTREKSKPAWAESMCALKTTRRRGVAAPKRPTTLTDSAAGSRRARRGRRWRRSLRNDHSATAGEQRAERAALPDAERRNGGVQRQHQAGAGRAGRRLEREVAGAELAHPVADALGHGALDRRAGEAVGRFGERADPRVGALLAIDRRRWLVAGSVPIVLFPRGLAS